MNALLSICILPCYMVDITTDFSNRMELMITLLLAAVAMQVILKDEF